MSYSAASGAIGVEVEVLHMRAEGVDIGRGDLQALLLEEGHQALLVGKALLVVPVAGGNGGFGHGGLFGVGELVPGLVVDGDVDAVDQMAGQHDLLGHFVELGSFHRW
jgi:hypothetical protein